MQSRYECVMITGASSGLGEEFAVQLAPISDHLILVARREEMLEAVAERLSGRYPGLMVTVLVADLAEVGGRASVLASLSEHGWVPDLLINNAGLGDYGEFVTADWLKLEAMLRVNIEALTHLTHAVVGGMVAMGRGAVIHVSSLASLMPIPDFAVYAATKAYVTSFSEALRLEMKDHGIPVLALCPGPVHTEFGEVARRADSDRKIPGREWFYVDKQQVVAEALQALECGRARVFPHWKTAAAALVISAIPILLMRGLLSLRPRK